MIDACRGPDRPYDMILLDEINIALRYDYLPLAEVVDFLSKRPEMLHVIVTGRNAKPELIEAADRSEEHTSELQSLMRISYAVFCLKKTKHKPTTTNHTLYLSLP